VRPLAAVYDATRVRITELIRRYDAGPEAAGATPVPACPSWTVHDVIAHVSGIYDDIMSGNVGGTALDEWTAAQVARTSEMSTADLLAVFDDAGPKLAAIIDDSPGRYGSQVVGDLAVHEQDIRGALRSPGARNSLAVGLSTEFLMEGIVCPGAKAMGLGPIKVRAGDRSWIVGTGDPPAGDPQEVIAAALASGEPHQCGGAPPVGGVTAAAFDLFRALTGRRSADQIRRFEWTLDAEPYLALFRMWPFTMRDSDLVE
jgi:hypothetical protein